jgi:serine/threonine protein kinase
MGEVYKGRAIQTGDAVAIKMIRPDMARDEAALALFRREAAALHNLYNEAIVRYYVFAIDPVTRIALSRNGVRRRPAACPSASSRVRSASRRSTPCASASGPAFMPPICSASSIATSRPTTSSCPAAIPRAAKIIDFGIARSSILGEGTVIGSGFAGKYNYVSPEQLGLHGGEVSGRSDMYSVRARAGAGADRARR